MAENQQVLSIGKPGEMTLLIGEEKVKFDLYRSMPLTNEEKRMRIESLLSPIDEHAPMFLKEDTLEGFEFVANSLSTKKLAFELLSHIMEVEKFILASDKDDEGVLAMMNDRPTQISQTSPKSLAIVL